MSSFGPPVKFFTQEGKNKRKVIIIIVIREVPVILTYDYSLFRYSFRSVRKIHLLSLQLSD